MKKFIVVFVFCLFNLSLALCQSNDTLTLKDLEIPNSPGFILLDKAPSAIERPNSSKAFTLSVINSFKENNGIPNNYAVEFSPFWYIKHPNMSALKYAGFNNLFSKIDEFSVSFAYVTTYDSLNSTPVNNISVGLRTNLISVRSAKDINDLNEANVEAVKSLKSIMIGLIEAKIIYPLPVDSTDEWKKKKKDYDSLEKAFTENYYLRQAKSKYNLLEIMKRKPVFAVDFALGYSCFFLDNNFSSNHFGRAGAWMTANYSGSLDNDGTYFNCYLLGRYLHDRLTMANNEYVKLLDLGGKLEFEIKNLSIGYEYIYRINDKEKTFRSNGIIKYKISNELYLTTALGKNFGSSNNLISLIGLNWGLSTGKEKAPVKDK